MLTKTFIAVFVLIIFSAGCGVKKSPDSYYTHPFEFNNSPSTGTGQATPTPTPSGTTP